ncbi:MAG: transcription elongation factor GreA [Mycoplasmataceae bacterium]|jgi:transcription elongation factor GreA|nr:transcription elongation factor GreA [Mycoplasmataceae bacterium]
MENIIEITKEKKTELETELKNLVDVERPNVIKELSAARDQGDLSENADYDAAKNRQGEVESRINEIQTTLKNVKVISSVTKSDRVKLGSTVSYTNVKDGEQATYTIVSEIEVDPENNKISNLCPVAKCLIGRSVGDTVEVTNIKTPYKIKITKIQ